MIKVCNFGLAFVFIFCITETIGQENTLNLSVGYTQSVGKFAANTTNPNVLALAKGGFLFDLNFTRKIRRDLGISLGVINSSFSFDLDRLVSELEKETGGSLSGDSKNYRLLAGYIGLNHEISMARSICFIPRIKFGVGSLRSSLPVITGTVDGEDYHHSVQSDPATGIFYGLGIQLKLEREKIQFFSDVNYNGAAPMVRIVSVTRTEQSLRNDIADVRASVDAINFMLGIAIPL